MPTLKGIRRCLPQISYIGVKIVSGWRQLRNNRHGKNSALSLSA